MTDKKLTRRARIIIECINVGIFGIVWLSYYNSFTFDKYRVPGGAASLLLFLILYNVFCNVYKAFRIASYSIGETLFSQVISFGLADLILYVECCLISNHYVSLLPGTAAAAAQILCTAVWAVAAKRYFMGHIEPKRTLIVYGVGIEAGEVERFRERLLTKYRHLFRVEEMVCESVGEEKLLEKLEHSQTVLLYEVSYTPRIFLADASIRGRKELLITPRIEDILMQGCEVKHLLDTPLFKYGYSYQRKKDYGMKRVLDIALSLLILCVTSPIMLITALAIKLEDGGPVFYGQERCTKDGRVFRILKFRSMIQDAEKDGIRPCVAGDSRITRVGGMIRATRVDELPQLLNILKGDMSLVGPRPERVEHVRQYMEELPEFAYRMRVKGGLTGYAQIFGKYNTSALDKLKLDLIYIENQSLLLDLKLILLTLRTIFTPESTEGFSEERSRKMRADSKIILWEGMQEKRAE